MQISNEIYSTLIKLKNSLLNTINCSLPDHLALESFLYVMEKYRADIYDQVKYHNEVVCNNQINTINQNYHTNIRKGVLYLHIPEKLPTLKNISSYTHKQIILNVSEITSKYKGLFYNNFVIIIVKIYDKEKIWDADNRTIKPIQDGLVNAGVIKDDNLKNSCYMVQGFCSDKPYIDVFVLKAKNIVKFIDKNLAKNMH